MPKDIKEKYIPREREAILGYLTEELGEVTEIIGLAQKALGKIMRFGDGGSNPEVPPDQRVTNRQQLLVELIKLRHELVDLERATTYVFALYGPVGGSDATALRMETQLVPKCISCDGTGHLVCTWCKGHDNGRMGCMRCINGRLAAPCATCGGSGKPAGHDVLT